MSMLYFSSLRRISPRGSIKNSENNRMILGEEKKKKRNDKKRKRKKERKKKAISSLEWLGKGKSGTIPGLPKKVESLEQM